MSFIPEAISIYDANLPRSFGLSPKRSHATEQQVQSPASTPRASSNAPSGARRPSSTEALVATVLGKRNPKSVELRPGTQYVEKPGGVFDTSAQLMAERQDRKERRARRDALEAALVKLNVQRMDSEADQRAKLQPMRVTETDQGAKAVEEARKWLGYQAEESRALVGNTRALLRQQQRNLPASSTKPPLSKRSSVSGSVPTTSDAVISRAESCPPEFAGGSHSQLMAMQQPNVSQGGIKKKRFVVGSSLKPKSHLHGRNQQTSGIARQLAALDMNSGEIPSPEALQQLVTGGAAALPPGQLSAGEGPSHNAGSGGQRSGGSLPLKVWDDTTAVESRGPRKLLAPGEVPTAEVADVHEVLGQIRSSGVARAKPTNALTQTVCALHTYGNPAVRSNRLEEVGAVLVKQGHREAAVATALPIRPDHKTTFFELPSVLASRSNSIAASEEDIAEACRLTTPTGMSQTRKPAAVAVRSQTKPKKPPVSRTTTPNSKTTDKKQPEEKTQPTSPSTTEEVDWTGTPTKAELQRSTASEKSTPTRQEEESSTTLKEKEQHRNETGANDGSSPTLGTFLQAASTNDNTDEKPQQHQDGSSPVRTPTPSATSSDDEYQQIALILDALVTEEEPSGRDDVADVATEEWESLLAAADVHRAEICLVELMLQGHAEVAASVESDEVAARQSIIQEYLADLEELQIRGGVAEEEEYGDDGFDAESQHEERESHNTRTGAAAAYHEIDDIDPYDDEGDFETESPERNRGTHESPQRPGAAPAQTVGGDVRADNDFDDDSGFDPPVDGQPLGFQDPNGGDSGDDDEYGDDDFGFDDDDESHTDHFNEGGGGSAPQRNVPTDSAPHRAGDAPQRTPHSEEAYEEAFEEDVDDDDLVVTPPPGDSADARTRVGGAAVPHFSDGDGDGGTYSDDDFEDPNAGPDSTDDEDGYADDGGGGDGGGDAEYGDDFEEVVDDDGEDSGGYASLLSQALAAQRQTTPTSAERPVVQPPPSAGNVGGSDDGSGNIHPAASTGDEESEENGSGITLASYWSSSRPDAPPHSRGRGSPPPSTSVGSRRGSELVLDRPTSRASADLRPTSRGETVSLLNDSGRMGAVSDAVSASHSVHSQPFGMNDFGAGGDFVEIGVEDDFGGPAPHRSSRKGRRSSSKRDKKEKSERGRGSKAGFDDDDDVFGPMAQTTGRQREKKSKSDKKEKKDKKDKR